MAYIGRDTDKISNIEKLDTITFDGSSSYTLQKNSVNFTPNSANSLQISIDGVVQAGNFTVSGSVIDFGVAIPATSTNDFIFHYGTGLVTTVADGAITTAKLGDASVTSAKLASGVGGKVLQVVQGTDSTERTTTSTSFVSATLNISITPSSTSNKILIMVSCTGYNTNGDRNIYTIDRSGTDLSGGNGFLTSQFGYVAAQAEAGQVSFNYLDSPSTTSSITYTLHHKLRSSGTGTASINYQSTVGTIIAMEISA